MRKKEYIKKKEYLDIYLSLMALFFLAPVFLTLVIAIKLDSPGPVFFKQKRVGIHQKHFKILKFRTMRTDTPKDMPTHLLQDPDQYITKVGKFLLFPVYPVHLFRGSVPIRLVQVKCHSHRISPALQSGHTDSRVLDEVR